MNKLYSIIILLSLFINNANADNVEYVGYVSTLGDMGWVSQNFRSTYKTAPPFSAHETCANNYTNSRAAEYEDFKYIVSDLPTGNYHLLNPYVDYDPSSYTFLLKSGEEMYFNLNNIKEIFCNNYLSASSSYGIFVVAKLSYTTKLASRTCNTPIRIACVTD